MMFMEYGSVTRPHLKQYDAKAEDVNFLIVGLAEHDLGRHVQPRPRPACVSADTSALHIMSKLAPLCCKPRYVQISTSRLGSTKKQSLGGLAKYTGHTGQGPTLTEQETRINPQQKALHTCHGVSRRLPGLIAESAGNLSACPRSPGRLTAAAPRLHVRAQLKAGVLLGYFQMHAMTDTAQTVQLEQAKRCTSAIAITAKSGML